MSELVSECVTSVRKSESRESPRVATPRQVQWQRPKCNSGDQSAIAEKGRESPHREAGAYNLEHAELQEVQPGLLQGLQCTLVANEREQEGIRQPMNARVQAPMCRSLFLPPFLPISLSSVSLSPLSVSLSLSPSSLCLSLSPLSASRLHSWQFLPFSLAIRISVSLSSLYVCLCATQSVWLLSLRLLSLCTASNSHVVGMECPYSQRGSMLFGLFRTGGPLPNVCRAAACQGAKQLASRTSVSEGHIHLPVSQ